MIRNAIGRAARRGALTLALALAPAATLAETLADALATAYTHSGLLQQNRALLRAADEDVAVAVAALRPIVSWASSFSRDFGYSYNGTTGIGAGFQDDSASFSVVAELLLYDFGATQLQIDAAKEAVLATREGLLVVEQQVLLRAVVAYVSVRSAAETVALRQNNLRLVQQELRAARDRFEVGEVTRTDVSLAEARLAASRANLAAAEGDLLRAKEEYRAAVGEAPGSLAAVSRLPDVERNEAAAKAIAMRTHPAMRRAQYEVSTAEINRRRAEVAIKPQVSLSGRLTRSSDFDGGFSNTGSVSLDFGGPIYRGGALSALERQARARADAARANLHVTQHAVAQDVGTALATLRVANASITATDQQIRAARVAFQGVREEATLGQRTTLDVLTAEQDLLDAEVAYTAAVADRTIAAYQLLSAMGLMTARHLGLNVQLYDPAEYYRLIKNAPIKSLQGDKLDRVLRRIGD